ncbi:MAG: rod-binding protein [Candidatus Brocadia sp.]|nr:rod-binding protein [Candidatus Brocadia sp.]NUO07184.1 rod-binding protein [Candidatus Brocadia sp.]
MDNYSSINPLLLSQPSCVETIKNLNRQKDITNAMPSLKKASQDFESILVNLVVNAMWKTIPKSDLFGENNGGMETYTEIMYTALSQDIVAKGGLGVAPIIYQQLLQDNGLAENTHKPPLLKNGTNTVDLTGNDKNGVNPS